MITINTWPVFTVAFTLMLIVIILMKYQSINFFTKDVVVRKFSILELEIPSSPNEIVSIIKGLYLLPADQSKKSVSSLRSNLYLDFLFMPLVYGSIFLLCWRVAHKIHQPLGYRFFIVIACLQLVSWTCDIIENFYILSKISANVQPSSKQINRCYLYMEALKWGIAMTGAVLAISCICYFFLTGCYSMHSLQFFGIICLEIFIYFAIILNIHSSNDPAKLN